MSHVSTTSLIKLAAGELPDDQRRTIEEHLAACPQCRAALEEHRTLRDVLGQWQVETGTPDMWSAIDRRLDDRRRTVIRPAWTTIGRIAAAVVLGVGVGYVGGRMAAQTGAPPRSFTMSVSDEEALGALAFEFIESPSATGLATTVLGLADDESEHGGAP